MSQTPYQPMHAAQKLVTQEDMWETLKRHLPPGSSLEMKGDEGQSPKEKPAVAPLAWQKPVHTGPPENRAKSGYVLTQCGRFSVCKEEDHGLWYTAWDRRTQPATCLGIRTDAEEAKRLCELAQETPQR